MELQGKRIFITGAARRLGREIAMHLSAKGCRVVAHYFRSAEDAHSLQKQTHCLLFQADFTTVDVSELRSRLDAEVGSVDILINNASTFREHHWTSVGEEFWNDELSVNLKIPFFLMQHFGPKMKLQGAGKIINLGDIAGQRPYLSYLPYSVAKAGIAGITRAFARALAPEVQVNSISPGTILFPESYDEPKKKELIARIPARRAGTVQELLNTIDFLLSDVDYITGQDIVMDGARSLTW